MRYSKLPMLTIFLLFAVTHDLQAKDYLAFSLKVAKEKIVETPTGREFRILYPEVFTLGGITAVKGLVWDRSSGDTILVGSTDYARAILTLDDLVIALRARFVHGIWPSVSIDPT